MSNIPQEFLFRFRIPCFRIDASRIPLFRGSTFGPETLDALYRVPFWTQHKTGGKLSRNPRVPSFSSSRSPENEKNFDFRIGWAPEGLLFTVVVRGKKRQTRRSQTDLYDADCIRFCVDGRDVKESRRGSRFCFKILFYPLVGDADESAKPLAQWVPINRAKESPGSIDAGEFVLASERRTDGYAFSAFLPSTTIPGFEPSDFPRMGAHFSVCDEEYGSFDLQHSALFPVEDDPSLWTSFEFVDGAPNREK